MDRKSRGLVRLSGVDGVQGSDTERLAILDGVYNRGEIFWDTGKALEEFSDGGLYLTLTWLTLFPLADEYGDSRISLESGLRRIQKNVKTFFLLPSSP